MIGAIKAVIFGPHTHLSQLRLAMFHSTPVLERKRRSYWQTPRSHRSSNAYSKRFRKMQSKKTLLRNISSYADYLFQSWQEDLDEDDPSTSKGPSWFKKQHSGRSKKGWNLGHQYWDKRVFQFCEDDEEIDVDFSCRFYWSFINEENTKWRSSSGYHHNYTNFGDWRARFEEDYESSSESDNLDSDMALDRQALGLSAYGPLKLEEVKTAYRACALKWHPDRHQGSSKVVAEEKFKLCSQAYQSLCDKLAVN
ncbi:uncharacterized protein LOC123227131 [Mangifera indica]|uniref:uncharacterized protein LOC123227131 n=1 Tax=Mangifera indica TaxID=29780 RepID=UPI001CF95EED|nr:uncharacterized protein LOC123227131 [Mangifera indica]